MKKLETDYDRIVYYKSMIEDLKIEYQELIKDRREMRRKGDNYSKLYCLKKERMEEINNLIRDLHKLATPKLPSPKYTNTGLCKHPRNKKFDYLRR